MPGAIRTRAVCGEPVRSTSSVSSATVMAVIRPALAKRTSSLIVMSGGSPPAPNQSHATSGTIATTRTRPAMARRGRLSTDVTSTAPPRVAARRALRLPAGDVLARREGDLGALAAAADHDDVLLVDPDVDWFAARAPAHRLEHDHARHRAPSHRLSAATVPGSALGPAAARAFPVRVPTPSGGLRGPALPDAPRLPALLAVAAGTCYGRGTVAALFRCPARRSAALVSHAASCGVSGTRLREMGGGLCVRAVRRCDRASPAPSCSSEGCWPSSASPCGAPGRADG